MSLIWFVIAFPVLVASAFFLILWYRPHHFYAPRDFGNLSPKEFVDAFNRAPKEVMFQATRSKDPSDLTAVYSLLFNILDNTIHQHLILMAEKSVDLPFLQTFGHRYFHGTEDHHCSNGYFNSAEFARKLEGTDFIEIVQSNGPKLRIKQAGRNFAAWLVQNGKKDQCLSTPFGGWGVPFDISRLGGKP
jgi:hypothetical protein